MSCQLKNAGGDCCPDCSTVPTDCCPAGFPGTLFVNFTGGTCAAFTGNSVAVTHNGTYWTGTFTPSGCNQMEVRVIDAGSCKLNIEIWSGGGKCIAGSTGVIDCPDPVAEPFDLGSAWIGVGTCGTCCSTPGTSILGTVSA